MPSVLWSCWLGDRKGIRPVKNWAVGCWHGYLSVARCRLAWPSWCHYHSLFLASVKSRLFLPFWYWLTQVVLDKGSLNVCVCPRCFCLHDTRFIVNIFNKYSLNLLVSAILPSCDIFNLGFIIFQCHAHYRASSVYCYLRKLWWPEVPKIAFGIYWLCHLISLFLQLLCS